MYNPDQARQIREALSDSFYLDQLAKAILDVTGKDVRSKITEALHQKPQLELGTIRCRFGDQAPGCRRTPLGDGLVFTLSRTDITMEECLIDGLPPVDFIVFLGNDETIYSGWHGQKNSPCML